MAVREYGTRSIRWRLGGAQWGPFEGGLNLRDSYNEVAPSELADGTNFTLDERGVASKRNDCPASTSFPAPPNAVIAFFYSKALGLGIIQSGASANQLYKCAVGGGSWTSFGTTRSTADPCKFVDFGGKLVYTHPFDGIFTYDAATNTSVAPTVFADSIAVWQNKVWAGSTGVRIWWSNAGNPAVWTTGTDFVDLRDKDDKRVLALYGGASGLLVFKEDSAYRINDSTNGAYQTIDPAAGCVGPLAVAGQDGRIVTWSGDGLYAGDGLGRFVNVGDKLRPRFPLSGASDALKHTISATSLNGRIYFSFPRTSTSFTDAIMEYNPRVGWLMESYFGGVQVGPFARYPNAANAAQVSLGAGSGAIKDLFTSTTRTGLSGTLTTGYIEPFGGRLGRLTRLTPQVFGTAGTAMTITINYIAISGAPVVWTGTFSLASGTGAQRPTLMPKIAGSAFQVTISDPNNIASFSLEAIDADFVLSSLR